MPLVHSLATGLFGLAVWAKTVVADAVAKLPLFDIALNERLLLWTLVSLCVLAALGANRIRRRRGRPAFVAGCVATLGLVGYGSRSDIAAAFELGMPEAYRRERVLAQVLPLVLALSPARRAPLATAPCDRSD